jgi:hypothetical protein
VQIRVILRENLARIDDMMAMIGRVKPDLAELAEWTEEGKARFGIQ